jgi:hypothetical protein
MLPMLGDYTVCLAKDSIFICLFNSLLRKSWKEPKIDWYPRRKPFSLKKFVAVCVTRKSLFCPTFLRFGPTRPVPHRHPVKMTVEHNFVK